MKIYTKTGDAGDTGLFAGPRVSKHNPRIEAYGAVDELNAVLGLARTQSLPPAIDEILANVQNSLFDVGAELATPDPKARGTDLVGSSQIEVLERAIDGFEEKLPGLKTFILPGGTPGAAWLHLARTVCRRAERRVVALSAQESGKISAHMVIYLNRLSDLLFVCARATNAAAGQPDIPWEKSTS